MAVTMKYPALYTPREAAQVLGISYASLKQWIYRGRLASVKTEGGHHRIPETEIDRLLPRAVSKGPIEKRRKNFRRISGRNQLVGRVMDVRVNGLIAQVTLSLGKQHITSIVTADAVRRRCGERHINSHRETSATAPVLDSTWADYNTYWGQIQSAIQIMLGMRVC